MDVVADDFDFLVDREYLAALADFVFKLHVNFGVEGDVWVIEELLLVSVLPDLKVAYFDVVEDEPHREIVRGVLRDLAIFPSFKVGCLDDSPDALQNRVDKLHVEA